MMLRNMVTSLLQHEKIETTLAKAKELRGLADKVILLAKRGDLHARRQALAILTDKSVVKKLFSEIGPRFQERTSGFTHIFRLGNRVGDAAPLSMVMLTEEGAPVSKEKKGTGKIRTKAKKTKPTKTKKKSTEKKRPEKEEKAVKEAEPTQEPAKGSTPTKKKGTAKTQTKKKSTETTSKPSP